MLELTRSTSFCRERTTDIWRSICSWTIVVSSSILTMSFRADFTSSSSFSIFAVSSFMAWLPLRLS